MWKKGRFAAGNVEKRCASGKKLRPFQKDYRRPVSLCERSCLLMPSRFCDVDPDH